VSNYKPGEVVYSIAIGLGKTPLTLVSRRVCWPGYWDSLAPNGCPCLVSETDMGRAPEGDV